MANLFRQPKKQQDITPEEKEITDKFVQEMLSFQKDSITGQNVPFMSPYPKTRHKRSTPEMMNVDKHIHKNNSEPFENFPFPNGKVKDELAQYEDVDLARLVDNCYRACWMFDRIIRQPLTEEVLHYYVYVSYPCRLQFQMFYRGQEEKTPPSNAAFRVRPLEAMSEIEKFGPEPLLGLILTDLSYRNNNLANQVEHLCKKVTKEASEADDYFGRLIVHTPGWWNERNYIAPIKKYRICLMQLLEKLSHIGQLYENELKKTKQEKGGQDNDGNADLPNGKTSESWLWKLYEKTIKAAFDAILDKINPS